jgi:transcriptional regulator with XRE-family HTH domain
MYKNKNGSSNNIAGKNIAKIRKEITPVMSQRALADKMQLFGIDLDKNAIQRIECGKRFITDIELLAFSKVLNTSLEKLLE